MRARIARWAAVAALLIGARLGAQATPAGVRVRVHVSDTARAAVSGAEALLTHGGGPDIRARTDSAGDARLVAPPDTGYQLIVRKVGYDQVVTPMRLRTSDTVWTVEIQLPPLARWLAPMVVKDKSLPRARQPYLDSAEIASSSRSMLSLRDVVGKLRFQVDYQSAKCLRPPPVAFVDAGVIPRARGIHVPNAVVYVNGRQYPREWNPWDNVHAEAIQEMLYVNCFDGSIPGLPKLSWPAVYVVLKPGYDWDAKDGSFKVDSTAR
ncbi:MAG: carboxypeptidase-like regulatory domain-containing protein [Gemmatimonadales bacterium]